MHLLIKKSSKRKTGALHLENFVYTVKPVYNYHPCDQEKVVIVHLVVATYLEVVVNTGLTVNLSFFLKKKMDFLISKVKMYFLQLEKS